MQEQERLSNASRAAALRALANDNSTDAAYPTGTDQVRGGACVPAHRDLKADRLRVASHLTKTFSNFGTCDGIQVPPRFLSS